MDSQAYRAFAALGGPLERQRFVPVWERRLLDLPASFDEFLAGRSRKIRFGVRYDTPIGPMRFDVGIQLNPIDGLVIEGTPEKRKWRVHFSIGQAF